MYSSSSCPAIFYIMSFQWSAQAGERSSIWFSQVIPGTLCILVTSHDVFDGLGFSTHTCGGSCYFPFLHGHLAAFFADPQAVQRFPDSPRMIVAFSQALSGLMPLSIHRVIWLPRLFHWFCRSVILASVEVVSSTSVVCRKLLLELSHFWAAEYSWSEGWSSWPGERCQGGHKGSVQRLFWCTQSLSRRSCWG